MCGCTTRLSRCPGTDMRRRRWSQPSNLFPGAPRGPGGRIRRRQRAGTTVPGCEGHRRGHRVWAYHTSVPVSRYRYAPAPMVPALQSLPRRASGSRGADVVPKAGWDHRPRLRGPPARASCAGAPHVCPGVPVPICADADGPRPPISSQTRLGVPGGGSGADSGLGPPSQAARATGEGIVCGRTTRPGAPAPICTDTDGLSPPFSSQMRLGIPGGGWLNKESTQYCLSVIFSVQFLSPAIIRSRV